MSLASQLVEGYHPEQFFVDLPPNFICGICEKIARDAVECPAGQHFFCESCVQRSRYAECSCCIVNLNTKTLQRNEGARNVVNNYMIRCESRRCTWQGKVSEYHFHQEFECGFVECVCPLQCGYTLVRCQLPAHSLQCPNSRIPCTHCSQLIPQSEIMDHLRICDMVVVPCPTKCMKLITRANLDYHGKHQCSRRMVECPMDHQCRGLFVAEDLELHIQKSKQQKQKRLEERTLQLRMRQQREEAARVSRETQQRPRRASPSSGTPVRNDRDGDSNYRGERAQDRRRDEQSPPRRNAENRESRGSRGLGRANETRDISPRVHGQERVHSSTRENERDVSRERKREDRHSGSRRTSAVAQSAELPTPHTFLKEDSLVRYHLCNGGKQCGCRFSEPHHVCNGTNCKCDKERAKHICNATICSCTYVKSDLSSRCRCTFAVSRHICNGGKNCICSVEYREHICNATPNCNCCFDPALHLCFAV